ncbi:hypothetical protein SUDANB70_01385 [Streptomyces sp. enrichment culture]
MTVSLQAGSFTPVEAQSGRCFTIVSGPAATC